MRHSGCGWMAFDYSSAHRCRHLGCDLAERRVWHNFISTTENGKVQHIWTWPPGQKLQHFSLQVDWGVSTVWLRQMSRRLV
eukprot:3433836-Amphidinium_carterae.2